MDCPKCGYVMSELDTECPRCKRMGAAATAPRTPAPPVAPAPVSPAMPAARPIGAPRPIQNTSGSDLPAPLEVSQMGWCWGAFGLAWIWGIGNQVWVTFLGMVPCIGLPVAIWLGLKGHEMAWHKRSFTSFDQYRDTMKVWNTWGLWFFIASMAFNLFVYVPAVMLPVFVKAREKAVAASCIANEQQITLSILQYAQDNKEQYPPAQGWRQALTSYIPNQQVFECPGGGTYGYNTNLAGYSLSDVRDPMNTGMIFEADENNKPIYPHDGSAVIGFADGHCALRTQEQVEKEIVW